MYIVTRLAPELDIRNTVVSRQANSRQSERCLERAVRSWISAVLEMESESVIEQPHRSFALPELCQIHLGPGDVDCLYSGDLRTLGLHGSNILRLIIYILLY